MASVGDSDDDQSGPLNKTAKSSISRTLDDSMLEAGQANDDELMQHSSNSAVMMSESKHMFEQANGEKDLELITEETDD